MFQALSRGLLLQNHKIILSTMHLDAQLRDLSIHLLKLPRTTIFYSWLIFTYFHLLSNQHIALLNPTKTSPIPPQFKPHPNLSEYHKKYKKILKQTVTLRNIKIRKKNLSNFYWNELLILHAKDMLGNTINKVNVLQSIFPSSCQALPMHTQSTNKRSSSLSEMKPMLTLTIFCLLAVCIETDSCYSVPLSNKKQNCSICQNKNYFINCTHLFPNSLPAQLNQSDCFTQCCAASIGQHSDIVLCANSAADSSSNGSSNSNITVILLVVFFSVPSAMCLYVIISHCCKQRRFHHDASNRSERYPRAPDPEPSLNLEDFDMHAIGPYYLQSDQSCSICLDDQCEIITRCGHFYHSECLRAWVTKTNKCPMCVSTQFNPIIYYCTKCHRSVKLGVINNRQNPDQVQSQQHQIFCSGCRQQNQRENCDISINMEVQEPQRNRSKDKAENNGVNPIQSSKSLARIM